MARCDGDCTTFQPDANTRWFKIAQAGLKQPNVPDTWYQKDTMNGVPIEVVLPQNLAPGGYIVRHETVSLHLAGSVGGAEFYPSCLQLRVTGNGNGVPDQTVRFPGAYNENDPGLVGNVSNIASPEIKINEFLHIVDADSTSILIHSLLVLRVQHELPLPGWTHCKAHRRIRQ
jgi:hypothetical protein